MGNLTSLIHTRAICDGHVLYCLYNHLPQEKILYKYKGLKAPGATSRGKLGQYFMVGTAGVVLYSFALSPESRFLGEAQWTFERNPNAVARRLRTKNDFRSTKILHIGADA